MRWVQLCGSLSILWHCLSLGLEWKQTFPNPMAIAEFSKFTGILSAALPQHHFFRIWNSSTGIPSPPLALFIVMLPKAHLTSHSRMSGSRWVITPSWLSGSWRYCLTIIRCSQGTFNLLIPSQDKPLILSPLCLPSRPSLSIPFWPYIAVFPNYHRSWCSPCAPTLPAPLLKFYLLYPPFSVFSFHSCFLNICIFL